MNVFQFNGSPLQCSCLENPRDGGAWRAAVYGVTQSRTRLKWLSSSSMLMSTISSFCIDSYIITSWSSLSSVRNFVLKSVFSDISMATPIFLVISTCLKYPFLSPHFLFVCASALKWVSYKQHIYRSYVGIYSATLCTLI